MELVAFKREQEQYRQHLQRIRNSQSMIDNKIPGSLGLSHLQSRAKKMQLREDRKQSIAMENRKLMENMTKILSEGRKQDSHIKTASKNERVRKEQIDKINKDNKAIVSRLEGMSPIISSSKLEDEFKKHMVISQNLRRRRRLFQTLATQTTMKDEKDLSGIDSPNETTSMFPSLVEQHDSPIRTLAEFRAQVIAKKKLDNRPEFSHNGSKSPNYNAGKNSPAYFLAQFENLPGMGERTGGDSNVRFELSHNPNSS